MFNRNKRKRGLFAAMSLTLVAALGFAGAPSAMAVEAGDMPTTGTGKIVIHKYDSAKGSIANANGKEQTVNNDPLQGVKFKITKVTNFDINSNADWAKIKTIKEATGGLTIDDVAHTVGVAGTSFNLDTTPANIHEVTTGTDGSAEQDNLAFGAYLVQETDPGNNAISKKADPFLITLPLPNDAAGDWLTTVHVYPKNDVNKPGTKAVSNDPDLKKIGDEIEWTITTTMAPNRTRFGIYDQLEDYLTYVDNSVEVTFNGTTVDAGKYDVVSTPKAGSTKGNVKIEFKKANIAEFAAGGEVKFKLKTTLIALPGNGKVDNNGFPIDNEYDPFNDPNNPPTPPINTPNPPYYGEYKFTKVDAGNQKTLKGAKFAICAAGTLKDACTESTAIATADSDATGVVDFPGIYLGLQDPGATGKEFVLKEIVAPAGYVLDDAVKTIRIKAGPMADSAQNFPNTRQGGPNLPMTGAAGMVLLTLAGVAVFAIATGLGFVNKRRKNA